jgi:hypothetical protein
VNSLCFQQLILLAIVYNFISNYLFFKMSWFGLGGGASTKKDEKATEVHDLNQSSPSFSQNNTIDVGSPSNGITNKSKFEQDIIAEQEKVLVQAVIFKLTEISFEKCVTKPSSQLSSAERNCIAAVTTKYLETSQFVVNGLGPALMNQQHS